MTGMAHSGSRLLVQMFDKHPDVATGLPILTQQGEFLPLFEYFLRALDSTPLHSETYAIDRNELFFILDAFTAGVATSRPYCVIKQPYYPLNCLDIFLEYFEGNIRYVFIHRPVEKILQSFLNRHEDRLFFENNRHETIRQIKHLGLAERKHFLVNVVAEAIFRAQTAHCQQLRDLWNQTHPESAFITVDIEQVATSRGYLADLLDKLGLSTKPIGDMMGMVDEDRLLHHREANGRHTRGLKAMARSVTPPVVWELAARLKNQVWG
jgi:hypothetical protein